MGICLVSIQFTVMIGMEYELSTIVPGKKRQSVSRVMVLKRNQQKSATESKDPVAEEKPLLESFSNSFGDYLATSKEFDISEQACSPDIKRSGERPVFF